MTTNHDTTETTRTEWLASLKPGSRVYVHNHFGPGRIALVRRITPTGRIVVGLGGFQVTVGTDGYVHRFHATRQLSIRPTR